jgi:L-ascorbate metabolism protein UlaG (beta-lactamase superfamily)
MNRAVLTFLAVFLLAFTAASLYLFSYPASPIDPDWELPPLTSPPQGGITVRFGGTSTLLFSDGQTQWMIDGWFTRPGPLTTLFGKIEPDLEAIEYGLARNNTTDLAAVIPIHSHYDHAMDSPEVARRTGAMLIGSEASANIARGWGLAEEKIRVVSDREEITLGKFRITFIESRHLQYPNARLVEALITQSEIHSPLVPPATIYDYKLGKAYVLHVRHPRGDFMVVGSAGFVPGLLTGIDVDTLFLGIGGLGSQTAQYRDEYWQHTAGLVDPERIVLIHWDSLTSPLDGPLTGEVRIAGLLMGDESETLEYLNTQASRHPGVTLQTLPRFAPVLLFP